MFSGLRAWESNFSARMTTAIYREAVRNDFIAEFLAVQELPRLPGQYYAGGISWAAEAELSDFWRRNFNTPLIRIGALRRIGDDNIGSIQIDVGTAVAEAVKYLAELKHQKIAYISELDLAAEKAVYSLRYQGFAGAQGNDSDRWFAGKPNRDKLAELLKQGVTAMIVVSSSEYGITVYSMLKEVVRRRKFPALVTYEMEKISPLLTPRPLLIRMDYAGYVAEAMKMLAAMLKGAPADTVRMPARFVL